MKYELNEKFRSLECYGGMFHFIVTGEKARTACVRSIARKNETSAAFKVARKVLTLSDGSFMVCIYPSFDRFDKWREEAERLQLIDFSRVIKPKLKPFYNWK